MVPKEWKVLCIGNSFSQDTLRNLPQIAMSLGVENIKAVNLYVSGCSIKMHYHHAINDLPAYRYDVRVDGQWDQTPDVTIRDALTREQWDWVSIQHGSSDGSYYTKEEDYSCLPALVEYIRQWVWPGAKIAFNMTWLGEPDMPKQEYRDYAGDQARMYADLTKLTRSLVEPMSGIDLVVPTGTAVQNARTATLPRMTRDKYHLTMGIGCYIAGLTFFRKLTDAVIDHIDWTPEDTDAYGKAVAIASANRAIAEPYCVTSCADIPL